MPRKLHDLYSDGTHCNLHVAYGLGSHLKTGQLGTSGTVMFYPFRRGLSKPVFVPQFRGLCVFKVIRTEPLFG